MSPNVFTERDFPLHSIDTAPKPSRPALEWYQQNFAMVPYLAGVLAESPALLLSYWQTQLNLLSHSTLTRQQINIVQTTVAHVNECQYCVAGHSAFGKTDFFDNSGEQLDAVRRDRPFDDPALNALRDFTVRVLQRQGRMSSAQLDAFLQAGFSRAQALDVVACCAVKVMSNYANQIALTPLDDAFSALAEALSYKEARGKKAA